MSTSEAIPSYGLRHCQGNRPAQRPGGGGGAAATMFGCASLSPLEAESTVVAAAAAGDPGARPAGEGRAGRAARRRPRASRKAPTTLLSTDAANFRAMVQQFTGVPSSGPAHVAAGYLQETVTAGVGVGGATSLAFGLGGHPHHEQPPVAFPFGMQQQFPQYQQQHDRTASALWGGRGSGTAGDDGGFLGAYGLGGGVPPRWNVEVSDHGYLLESMSSSSSAASSEVSNGGCRTYGGFLL